MRNLNRPRYLGFGLLFALACCGAGAEEFTNAIQAHLQSFVHSQMPRGCIVVGLVDEQGPRVLSCGELDNGTDALADGNTLFALQSACYTFFALLLQDAVDRGELEPDAPVQQYLPASVKMPAYHGQPITLRHLARETSGLHPALGEALAPQRFDAPFEGLPAEKFFALVSHCQLTAAPGTTHEHGGIDRGVLNQTVAWRAGMDFESLLCTRLLRPLGMKDTRLSLTPEMEARFAPEHSKLGWAMPRWRLEDYPPLSGIFSSANDLLKMLSACGLSSSQLRPRWDNTCANFAFTPQRAGQLRTGGGWYVNGCYLVYDTARRRGVVVLANACERRTELGQLLLESEWQSERRPQPVSLSRESAFLLAGQYQRSPDAALGRFVLRHYLLGLPWTVTILPASLVLVALVVVLWRVKSARQRWFLLGAVALLAALCLPLLPSLAGWLCCARLHPGIGIRCEGARLFAEPATWDLCTLEDWPSAKAWQRQVHPIDVLFPPLPVELLAESENRCFERLSGVPMTFTRDARGKVSGLTLHYRGQHIRYDKTSAAPPSAPVPVKPPVVVHLATNLLEACAGTYAVAPVAGIPKGLTLNLWREGAQLFGRVQQPGGDHVLLGTFPLFPVSDTNCFEKLTGAELRFVRNAQGQVTGLAHHNTGATLAWFPDWEARKVK